MQEPSAQPIRPTNEGTFASWRSARRIWLLILPFLVLFAASWWLTPIVPYTTLNVGDECELFLFSPDSSMLVTSGIMASFGRSAGPLRVWDVSSGHERFSVAHDWTGVETVLFSPDSRLLAAHEWTGDLTLWNTKTGQEVARLRPETKYRKWVNWRNENWLDFRFSPDGRFLVFQDYNENRPDKDYITFWNIETRQEQGIIEGSFHSLAFARDGNSFGTCRERDGSKITDILLWRMDLLPVMTKRNSITAKVCAFSPDLHTLATADDLPDGNGQVAMWDTTTGAKCWSVNFNESGTLLHSLTFTANGKVLSAVGLRDGDRDWSWRTTLWDVTATPKEIGSFSPTPALSEDGEWLAIPLESGVKLIRPSAPERGAHLIVNGDSRWGGLNSPEWWKTPSFSSDNKLILVKGLMRVGHDPYLPFQDCYAGGTIRVWDTDRRRELLAFSNCTEAQFSPNGHVLATLRAYQVNNCWCQAIDLWSIPFRGSVWRTLCMSSIVWLLAVPIWWLDVKAQRRILSTCTGMLRR
jgi:WD40 repeat protein